MELYTYRVDNPLPGHMPIEVTKQEVKRLFDEIPAQPSHEVINMMQRLNKIDQVSFWYIIYFCI